MAVNFIKNQDEITKAWREVVESKDVPKWALFGYEGNTNIIKLMSTGSDGLKGLVREFNCSLIQYAFCRVVVKDIGVNKLVLINWQGDSSPLSRKGLCASHVGDVANYFKGCTQTITIRNDDEATQEYLMNLIVKSSASRFSISKSTNSIETSSPGSVGSTYKKTDITSEITNVDRKSFWQRQEEEEKERLVEEKKRAAEKQAQFEKERKLREETEAKRLSETIKERDRFIEASRQADRKDSSSSQPSSIVSSNVGKDNEDERVGRRSELIRLERNQETQALISKGLIKNKRAIFEKASQEQSNQQLTSNNLTRRASGTMVTQRMNSLKSFEEAASGNSGGVNALSNGFAKGLDLGGNKSAKTVTPIKKEVETIKLEEDVSADNHKSFEEPTKLATSPVSNIAKSPIKPASTAAMENGNNSPKNDSKATNGNNNYISNNESGTDDIQHFKAKALYDYQAADHTEISFDPDDLIGFIDKVDSGWWHGQVITGRFKGQNGLFPANYVEEI